MACEDLTKGAGLPKIVASDLIRETTIIGHCFYFFFKRVEVTRTAPSRNSKELSVSEVVAHSFESELKLCRVLGSWDIL